VRETPTRRWAAERQLSISRREIDMAAERIKDDRSRLDNLERRTSFSRLIGFWSGSLPSAASTGQTVIVPFQPDGSSLSFTLDRLHARIETVAAADVEFEIEHSPGGGAFVATSVGSVVIDAGDHEGTTTGIDYAVVSGELLRISFVTVDAGNSYFVQLIGSVD